MLGFIQSRRRRASVTGADDGERRTSVWLRRARAALPPLLLAAAAYAVHRELRSLGFHHLAGSLEALPRSRVALAAVATLANYLVLTGYDVLALRYVGRPLPYPRVALASFVSYAFGHNMGASILSGGSVRFRLYSQWGLGAPEITRIVVFTAATLWLGLGSVAGVALAAFPATAARWLHAGAGWMRLLGAALVAVALAYLALSTRRRTLELRGFSLPVPGPAIAAGQLAVAAADWTLAAAVLYALVPPAAGLGFAPLLGLFLVAQLAALVSQVPGGVGVFDSIVLTGLTPALSAQDALALLVAYRIVYYLAPFLLAGALLVAHELALRRHVLGRLLRGARAPFAAVVPWLAAAGAFVCGAVLLFSGATPTVNTRLGALRHVVPLPLLEASHFLGSLAGVALLLLARGLQRRLDAAFALTVALLAAGAALSLVKGLDWEEAALLLAVLALVLPFRDQFYRRGSLVAERFTRGWTLAVALVVAGSAWVGWFSYRHLDYGADLFWRFTFHADAPRFLRATAGAVSLAIVFGAAQLLRPAVPEPAPPREDDLEAARRIASRHGEASAFLALVGDKALLFDEARTAFLMYGVSGRAWVAMGDPVGADEEATELAWRFHALSDRHRGWTCFYQVGPAALGRYLDLGLSLLKLGEEASVPLPAFSLDGPERRTLRQSFHRAEREGLRFELVPREEVPPLLPVLKAISDAWLEGKSTREKGFSLGYFEPRYLSACPVALVRRGGDILAFANVWAGESRAELSVDLMRFTPSAPREAMEFLFVNLMLWGRAEGFAAFNLGMAPLSGLEARALAPAWARAGALLYRYGEHFYNFQGIRQYKEKFDPVWKPRYLATPGGLALPRVLAAVAALVSRGLKGAVSR